ncbi:MAG TPA: hypothetical protein VJB87_03375 [Candidatus Nanoarchaeia archaeon]|nr:hypothetical protein [Candidatus Nanoarchaeia archaeon]
MQILLVIVYSIIFAATIKIADLLDEHGLKLFKGSKTLFGILWGVSFLLLTTLDAYIAGFWIAFLLYWILNHKIDYHNHCLATAIIFAYYLWKPPLIDWLLLSSTLIIYLGFYLHEKYLLRKRTIILRYNLHILILLLAYTYAQPAALSAILAFVIDSLVYHGIKSLAAHHGYT